MILRRVIAHFRKQEWTAIFLDFVIVVLGVFVATQVTNWNAARSDESAYRDAMRRVAEESRGTVDSATEVRTIINGKLSAVEPAIEALRECQTGPDAEAIVTRGLNTIRGTDSPEVVTLAIDQLVSDERLLNRQSDAQRTALRRYHADLHSIEETARAIDSISRSSAEDTHPLIGFSDVVDPRKTVNKVDIRNARINAPMAEVCKDQSFLQLFYNWERTHVFQLKLIADLELAVANNARALDLASFENNSVRGAP